VRALLVINPHSRRGHELGGEVRYELRRAGVEIVEGRAAGRDVEGIVAVGGDGTFASQIPRALALGVPLGLVPAGTFNDLARTLSIPGDVAGACATIAAGRTRAVDLACVNGVYYVTEASIGISSRLAREQRPADKKRFGLLAIIASAFRALGHARPFHVEVGYDGRRERLRTIQLTVANGERFGGIVTVDEASIDDGWLDLYSVEIDNVFEALSVAGAVVAGKRRDVRGLRTFRSIAFEVRTRRRYHITADGEPAGTTPARFELAPKALRIFAP